MNGAFTKDPKRKAARANEPLPNGPVGDPPNLFDDIHRDAWWYIVDLVPEGVLTKADRLVVELMARLYCKMQEGSIRGGESNLFVGCLARLGLTPADRSRVTILGEKTDDGEEDLFGTFDKREIASQRPH